MQNPKQIVCKRVLGLEGDEVRIPQSTQLGPGRTVVVCVTLGTAAPTCSAVGLARENAEYAGNFTGHLMPRRCPRVMSGCKGTTSSTPQTLGTTVLYHMPSCVGEHS